MARRCFITIFGPPAVGKLAVAKTLAAMTGYKVVHNHLAIENALALYEFGTQEFRELVASVRRETLSSAARSELDGVLFTFVWNFASTSGARMMEEWCNLFRAKSWSICFLELEASLETRLERNRTPERAAEKPSKRDLAASERYLLENEASWMMNLPHGTALPIAVDFYLRIKNDTLSPQEVALRAKRVFQI